VRIKTLLIATCSLVALTAACGTGARAEYVVLRSGARLSVTGYELLGDHYRLQMQGGSAEIAADEVVSIEPEEIFEPLPEPLSANTPFHEIIRAAAERYSVDPDSIRRRRRARTPAA
jgi:hypothetical protein